MKKPKRRLAPLLAVFVVVGLIAGGWLWFRFQAKSWQWWQNPAVLHVLGRQYDRGTVVSSLKVAKAGVSGTWTNVGQEWPMRWSIWTFRSSAYREYSPTVVFLRTGSNHYVGYALQGGP